MIIKIGNEKFTVPDTNKWRSGPPPAIGWWPASKIEDFTRLRWWDGVGWSQAVHASQAASEIPWPRIGVRYAGNQEQVYWTDRWWEKTNV